MESKDIIHNNGTAINIDNTCNAINSGSNQSNQSNQSSVLNGELYTLGQ